MINFIDTLPGVLARLVLNAIFAIATVSIAYFTKHKIDNSQVRGRMKYATYPLFASTFAFFVAMVVDRYIRYFVLKKTRTPFIFVIIEMGLYMFLKLSTYVFYAVRLREAFLRSEDLRTSDRCFGVYFISMGVFSVGLWLQFIIEPVSRTFSFASGFLFDIFYQLVLVYLFASKLHWIAKLQVTQNPEQFAKNLPFEDVIIRSLILVSTSCFFSIITGIVGALLQSFLIGIDTMVNLVCVILVFTFYDRYYFCCCQRLHDRLVVKFNVRTRKSTVDPSASYRNSKLSIALSKTKSDSEPDGLRKWTWSKRPSKTPELSSIRASPASSLESRPPLVLEMGSDAEDTQEEIHEEVHNQVNATGTSTTISPRKRTELMAADIINGD